MAVKVLENNRVKHNGKVYEPGGKNGYVIPDTQFAYNGGDQEQKTLVESGVAEYTQSSEVHTQEAEQTESGQEETSDLESQENTQKDERVQELVDGHTRAQLADIANGHGFNTTKLNKVDIASAIAEAEQTESGE